MIYFESKIGQTHFLAYKCMNLFVSSSLVLNKCMQIANEINIFILCLLKLKDKNFDATFIMSLWISREDLDLSLLLASSSSSS